MTQNITIITAFFDIGRGEWNAENGYSQRLQRTVDDYFSYFHNLAQLENDMVIFTSSDFKERIENIRQGKPTKIITIDLDKCFFKIKNKIKKIQQSALFRKKSTSRTVD